MHQGKSFSQTMFPPLWPWHCPAIGKEFPCEFTSTVLRTCLSTCVLAFPETAGRLFMRFSCWNRAGS
jgi:hypothetical protein